MLDVKVRLHSRMLGGRSILTAQHQVMSTLLGIQDRYRHHPPHSREDERGATAHVGASRFDDPG